jgi:cytoskeleton protein RodZ
MDIGAQLREAREAKGWSLGTISERTRVPARTLAAIERNDRAALPPRTFSRGFVRTYAEELDLDADAVTRNYFAQFPAEEAARTPTPTIRPDTYDPPQSRWTGMGTALAILLVVVAAAVVLGRRSDRAEPDSIGTSGATSTAAVPPAATSPAALPPPAATPTSAPPPALSAPGKLTVVLSMQRPCWVAATVDGQRTLYRIVQPGDPQTLVSERSMTLRFGDAGAVRWTINGKDGGTVGANGEVRTITLPVSGDVTPSATR